MNCPSIEAANSILEESYAVNPGPWRKHSISVAINAQRIAEHVEGMDADIAYVCGLLHDIGRREGNKAFMHTLDGYYYMMGQGYPDVAGICLTHSFPIKDLGTYFGEFDCSAEERQFVADYIADVVYDNYDKLIQLCDAISLPKGACLMEKRLVDVAFRHGLPSFTLDKWKAFMGLKDYFDMLCNTNIYKLLPNIIETTFGFE